jgi:hypothetical protein
MYGCLIGLQLRTVFGKILNLLGINDVFLWILSHSCQCDCVFICDIVSC